MGRLARWGLLGILFVAEAAWSTTGFMIHRAELKHHGSEYVLNADISYQLSPVAVEALENSVPLTIILHCIVERERSLLWNETLVEQRRKLQIRYHPLGQLYQMTQDDSSEPQRYASMRSLLAALGTIRGLPILAEERIESGHTYRASLAVSLDIESLPLPLRSTAYLSPSWYLSSPAYRWSFERSE